MTSDEFNKAHGRMQTNFDDLQNELAGREVGRARRFLSGDEAGPGGGRKDKGGMDAAALTALDILMQDPEYAALYNEVSDLLSRAEAAIEAALARAENDLSEANAELDDTLDSANRLPDGTAVFRDQNGNIRTEDGRLVEGEEAEGIVWKDNAPSYEGFVARKRAADAARERVEDLQRYQVDVLGRARDRMNDHDNPPAPDELRELQRDIVERAPEAVRDEIDPGVSLENTQAASHENTFDAGSPPI